MKRFALLSVAIALMISTFSISIASAMSDNVYNFGFKKSKNGNPASISQEGFRNILEKYDAIFLGDTQKQELYLTFDNGYENGYTDDILDILKEKEVPATFFVTGHYVKSEPKLIIRMVNEGHIIGNHSWSHPNMTKLSNEKIKADLDKVKNEVFKITGQLEMKYLRPPSGIFNEQVLTATKELGYTNVFWSIAYKDWEINKQKGWEYAYDKVMTQLHPGAVILLHTVSEDNAKALGKIIDDARKLGYEFKSLDEMQIKNY